MRELRKAAKTQGPLHNGLPDAFDTEQKTGSGFVSVDQIRFAASMWKHYRKRIKLAIFPCLMDAVLSPSKDGCSVVFPHISIRSARVLSKHEDCGREFCETFHDPHKNGLMSEVGVKRAKRVRENYIPTHTIPREWFASIDFRCPDLSVRLRCRSDFADYKTGDSFSKFKPGVPGPQTDP
jgi:hypothetical protein